MFAISTSKIMVFALYMASAISVVLLSQREGVLAVVCMSLLIMSIMLRFSHSRVVNGEVAEKHLPNRESDVPQAFPSKLRADAQEFVPGKKWDRPNSTPKGSSATKADASGELGGAADVFEEKLAGLARAARAREQWGEESKADESQSRVTRARRVGPHSAEFFLSQNPSASRMNPNTAAPASLFDKAVPIYQHLLAVGGRPSAPPGLLPPCNNENEKQVEKLVRRLHDLDKEARSNSDKPSSCRRMVAGWREAIRAVKRSRAIALVIAKDAGADTKIQAIMASANEKGIPCLIGMNTTELGQMIVGAKISTSVLVVLHVAGAEELFEQVSGIKARDTTAEEGDSSESS
jgi:ribosomal protein L7Ae-like RNA K-turn-binding protein